MVIGVAELVLSVIADIELFETEESVVDDNVSVLDTEDVVATIKEVVVLNCPAESVVTTTTPVSEETEPSELVLAKVVV